MPTEWTAGFGGGLMIGLAAAVYLLGNGRIMGASGLLGGEIDGSGRGNMAERLSFLAALIAVPALMVAKLGLGAPAAPVAGTGVLVLAALLVGFGTRLGNGCTSGHGVCGISRLSLRDIMATCVYLATGALAVLAARMLGWL